MTKTYTYTLTGTTHSREAAPHRARITHVNDRAVTGTCEVCSKMILEGQFVGRWADDVVTCYRHTPKDMR